MGGWLHVSVLFGPLAEHPGFRFLTFGRVLERDWPLDEELNLAIDGTRLEA